MKLIHNGISVELDDADPRVAVIQTLLYGRPLPAPLPFPVLPPAAPTVPENARRFWNALHPIQHKELVLLSHRPHTPAEMETALNISQRALMGRHSSLARLATQHRVSIRIRARGRARSLRRFYVDDDVAALITALNLTRPESAS